MKQYIITTHGVAVLNLPADTIVTCAWEPNLLYWTPLILPVRVIQAHLSSLADNPPIAYMNEIPNTCCILIVYTIHQPVSQPYAPEVAVNAYQQYGVIVPIQPKP